MLQTLRTKILCLLLGGWAIGEMASPVAHAQVTVQNAFPGIGFSSPVDLQAPPDGSDRLFVVERGGTIRIIEDIFGTPSLRPMPFLTIPNPTFVFGGERGLLGMAFHPDYPDSGYVYVFYTVNPSGAINTRVLVSRFTVSVDPNLADAGTELVLLGVDHPFGNHNAGQLQFGPDGYLYIGMGDGGDGGDPHDNGEDPTTLLGSILRIDVEDQGAIPADTCGAVQPNYKVPATNPFVDAMDGRCDEIYAYGFRNPWRFSFGPNDTLWVADVGQGAWEEIDWVQAGKNYGWDVMEGAHCFEPGVGCNMVGLELPIHEYGHNAAGGFSITGGYVYTGEACGALSGRYIYADFVSNKVWALAYDANGEIANTVLPQVTDVSSFGVDRKGELYIVSLGGTISKFDCTGLTNVNAKIFLHGPYDSQAGTMTTQLNAAGLLPLMPDTVQSWGHDGNEGIYAEDAMPANGKPDFFDTHPNLVDWVYLELRTDMAGTTKVASRMAWVRNDGMIVDMDGVSPVGFLGVVPDDYYLVIRHPNHLDVMSAGLVTLDASSMLYDFTMDLNQVHGGDLFCLNTGGPYGLYAGDANPDGTLSYIGASADQNQIINELGLDNLAGAVSGYRRADMNLDGEVRLVGGRRDLLRLLQALGLGNIGGTRVSHVPN